VGASKAYTPEAAISSLSSRRRSERDPRAKQGFGCGKLLKLNKRNNIARARRLTVSFCYSTFLLLDVSSPWLLLAVSITRHYLLLAIKQRFLYSTFPLNGITCNFTQTYHYPTFQLLDVSASPIKNATLMRLHSLFP